MDMVKRASVIVTELHLEGIPLNEPEADAPLVIHGDGVLTFAIATKPRNKASVRLSAKLLITGNCNV